MTYLATSLKLAKFSVTERTAGRYVGHRVVESQSNLGRIAVVITALTLLDLP